MLLNLAKNDDIILQTPFKGNAIYLRMNVNATRNEPLEGMYCYNTKENAGQVTFDDFVYHHDGPKINWRIH